MTSAAEKAVYVCAVDGDEEGLKILLGNKIDAVENMLLEKDEMGRNALFAACMLGRSGIVRELVTNGADVNKITARGYSPLHYSAMWGHLDTLKTLVELKANLQCSNFRSEKAIDVARRYGKLDCAEHLALSEAKESLQSFIQQITDTIASPDKMQCKLSKDEKNLCVNTCNSKTTWIQNTSKATVMDIEEQKQQLESALAPILIKLNLIAQPLEE